MLETLLKKILKKIWHYVNNSVYLLRAKIKILQVEIEHPRYGINEQARQIPVIVSMTSYDKRFSTLDLCIKSLLRQTFKPDRIILYLTRKDSKKLTNKILNLKKFGLEIIYVDEDLRPHNKYYYAMKENLNTILITVDDDCIYSRKLIERLMKTHKKFPNAVTATRARKIELDKNGFLPYNEWALATISNKPSNQLIATGVGGVLYPPHLLNLELLLNKSEIRKYIQVDDLWLKTVEILSQVPTVICDNRTDRKRIEIPTAQSVGLKQTNVLKNENDLYWLKLNKKYNLFDKFSYQK